MPPPSELWIGLVEIKPLDQKAYGAAGPFTHIVTWACDVEEYKAKAATMPSSSSLRLLVLRCAMGGAHFQR